MKKKQFSLAIIAIVLLASKGAETDYSKVLPGVVKISETVYYDKTEVTNFDWLEYLNWMKTNNTGQYKSCLPDSTVWIQALSYCEPYQQYYLRHPAYRQYPVVGVSWQQAADYCHWRTERVKEVLTTKGKLDKAPKAFGYRLPTKEEYLTMYHDIAQLPNKIGGEGQRKYRGMYRYNMKKSAEESQPQAGQINDYADITAPALSYWPNSFGLYNIKGNVAEWLMDKNTFVGGAWNTPLSADVSEIQTSEKPTASIGFRCVCEVMPDEI